MPAVNGSGEPCDREGHARFDGEALETGASAMVERNTRRSETSGRGSLAYGVRVPRQRLTLLKRACQGLVDRGGEAERIGRWGLAEIERLFALWHVRPGREAPAQAPDRHKDRREVLLRR